MQEFEESRYVEAARRKGGDLTDSALDWLKEQSMGLEYVEEAIHQEGAEYFERLFNSMDDVQRDYNLYEELTEESEQ